MNGERLLSASTDTMIFPIWHLMAYISASVTFAPGSVTTTETPLA